MESLLGFSEEPVVDQQQKSLYARRLVPWLNWDEWVFVKDGFFSSSPDSVASALKRVSAWRSRGCLPVVIEITASIIEIQQKDSYYRVDQSNDASLSEEMLAMLYCMAITRLVNGVVEKTRKKEEVSMAVAADAIGIPRMLIDVRHEGSHRELPALKVVRSASAKALDWLKSFYWEPQSKAIPFQGDGNAKLRKEIKSKLREVDFCLKVSRSPQSSGSLHKRKRVKHGELVCGRNKLLTLLAGKGQISNFGGSKKQISKILKSLEQLYSSFSSEIESVLLDYLLKALSYSDFKEHTENASAGPTLQSVLADWKFVILKFCNKEPELLLNLLKTVLDMIETQKAMKNEVGIPCVEISHSKEFLQIDHFSSLFAWLVGILSKVVSAEKNVPRRILLEPLRKCLLISVPNNKQLIDSALHLAKLLEDSSLMERVKKLSLLGLSNLDNGDDEGSLIVTLNDIQQEESIHEAARKLDLIKQQVMRNKNPKHMDCKAEKSVTWTLAKSWNPCPIGMLPRAVGSSGCLPVLDCIGDRKKNQIPENKGTLKLIQHSAKRDATVDHQLLDNSSVKKMREAVDIGELDDDILPMEGEKGCLLVGGLWKRVREEDILAIESSVRVLV